MGKSRQDLADDWQGVRNLQRLVSLHTLTAFARGFFPMHKLADLCYSLVLVQAYGVLADALIRLQSEGAFGLSKDTLGARMSASIRSPRAITWAHYDAVKKGLKERNDVAHGQKVMPREKSWAYINLIAEELKAWGIISDQEANGLPEAQIGARLL